MGARAWSCAASSSAAMQRHYILTAFLDEERASGGLRAGAALRVSLTSLTGMQRLCLGSSSWGLTGQCDTARVHGPLAVLFEMPSVPFSPRVVAVDGTGAKGGVDETQAMGMLAWRMVMRKSKHLVQEHIFR